MRPLRDELILNFMMALTGNQSICVGSEEDPQWIVEYAEKLADAFLNKPTIEDKNGNPV